VVRAAPRSSLVPYTTLFRSVVGGLTETEALALRGEGCNLLVPRDEAEETWDIADRFGFLVLGDRPRPEHASCLRTLLADPARGLDRKSRRLNSRHQKKPHAL